MNDVSQNSRKNNKHAGEKSEIVSVVCLPLLYIASSGTFMAERLKTHR